MKKKIKRSLLVVAIVLILFFIFKIVVVREILKLLLISFVFAYALRPLERKLVGVGLNKKLSAVIIILGSISILITIFIILIPSIIKDGISINNGFSHIKRFIDMIYSKIEVANKNETMGIIINSVYLRLNNVISNILNTTFDKIMSLGENILSYVVIPVIVYYFLSEDEKLLKNLLVFSPVRSRSLVKKIAIDIDKVLDRYIISQFILCFLITILTFVVLYFLKVDYPLLLAMLNGIFNIIPYFGPLFGAIPAIIVALVKSPQIALWTVICLYIIQQIEGDIISPKITGESISMHPLVVIILLIIGGKVGGFVGMVLAVPVGVIIKVIYDDLNYYLF